MGRPDDDPDEAAELLADGSTSSSSTSSPRGRWRNGVLLLLVGGLLVVAMQFNQLRGQHLSTRTPMRPRSRRHGHMKMNHSVPFILGADLREVLHPNAMTSSRSEEVAVKNVHKISVQEQERRRLAVKQAMQFTWNHYEEHAFGGDEMDPTTGFNKSHVWGGFAATMVDALDTLWLMDLKDEFHRARDWLAEHLEDRYVASTSRQRRRDMPDALSVFETMIRVVGGLLGAHALTDEAVFIRKAQAVADRLLVAFDAELGMFNTKLSTVDDRAYFIDGGIVSVADAGSLQLELRYLSDVTGNPKYAAAGDAFYKVLQREGSWNGTGLFSTRYDAYSNRFDASSFSALSMGSFSDSFYEYLLKVFVYSGKREEDSFLRNLYDGAVRGMEQHLMYYSESDQLWFLQNLRLPDMKPIYHMEHLACFTPGMLALGTVHDHDKLKNAKHLHLAKQLAQTCYEMYHRQPTGLSPESVHFPTMGSDDSAHRLRPEVIESLFYLFRVTKDERYREQGWEIFENLQRHTKTIYGYSSIQDVTQMPVDPIGSMETFFLAETLKYHYLLQAPVDLLSLDDFVLNTEAHPLRIQRYKHEN